MNSYRLGLLLLLAAAAGPWALPAQAQLPPPVITAIQPASVNTGERILIHGRHFTSYVSVLYTGGGNVIEVPGASGNGQTLSALVPHSLPSGTYNVSIKNVQGSTSSGFPVTVQGTVVSPPLRTAPPGTTSASVSSSALQITGLAPTNAIPQQRITVTGNGFGSYNNVRLTGGGKDHLVSAASLNGKTLIFTIPRDVVSGSYTVAVTTAGQTSNTLPLTLDAPVPSPTPGISPAPTPGTTTQCRFLGFFCRPVTHTYVAIGDSLGEGFVAVRGYVPRYHEYLERDLALSIRRANLSRSALRSGDLLALMQNDQSLRQAIAQADFITWNIGGNDLRDARDQYRRRTCGGFDNEQCLRDTVERFRQHWDGIVDELLRLRKNDAVVMRSMTIYNPFVGERDSGNLMPYWDAVNTHITTSLSARGIRFAPVAEFFNGPSKDESPKQKRLIALDGFHPNEEGHRIIADLLRQVGYNP